MVLSLIAKGLTSGEIVAHLAEVYGMTTKETVSTITDQALESMAEWRTRPLDPGRFPSVVATPERSGSHAAWRSQQAAAVRAEEVLELRRGGLKGAAAARQVGVSVSAGSVWFIDAGRMLLPDKPIDPRYLTQDNRITIADGLRAGKTAGVVADEIGKHRSTVYRESQRGRRPDGSYNPWWAHNQAIVRRRRPKEEKLRASEQLRDLVNDKLQQRWSPQQISRQLIRLHPGRPSLNANPETIYRALYTGLLDKRRAKLRTRRTRRKPQRRGIPSKNAIPRMRLIHARPVEAQDRSVVGHWEGDLIIGKGQASDIGTLVDRATRYLRLIHLPDGWKAPEIRDALAEQTADLPPRLRRTLTWDQGRELYLHQQIEEMTRERSWFS